MNAHFHLYTTDAHEKGALSLRNIEGDLFPHCRLLKKVNM
jgi:hypothetical protein